MFSQMVDVSLLKTYICSNLGWRKTGNVLVIWYIVFLFMFLSYCSTDMSHQINVCFKIRQVFYLLQSSELAIHKHLKSACGKKTQFKNVIHVLILI